MTSTFVFDVGVIALSHSHTPVSEPALDYIESAIRGEITGVVPTTAMLGAHHVMRNNYHISRDVSSDLLRNLQRSQEITWWETVGSDVLTKSLRISGENNIEAWDGYYSKVARECDADKILTLDDDFERVDDVDYEVILNESQFDKLLEFMDNLEGIRTYEDIDI